MYNIFHDGNCKVRQIYTSNSEMVIGNFKTTELIPEINKYYFERRQKSGHNGIKF